MDRVCTWVALVLLAVGGCRSAGGGTGAGDRTVGNANAPAEGRANGNAAGSNAETLPLNGMH